MSRYKLIAPTLIAATLMIVWAGCPGSTPTVTLTATDCEKDKIEIKASMRVAGSASNWRVVVNIKITCDGQPLPDAEIRYTNWLGETTTLKTNDQGEASPIRSVGTSDRPSGPFEVTVEIEGSDGTKTETKTVSE